jgi:uncharacterized protein YceK
MRKALVIVGAVLLIGGCKAATTPADTSNEDSIPTTYTTSWTTEYTTTWTTEYTTLPPTTIYTTEIEEETTPEEPSGFLCKDGTTSHAKTRRGACSHHGGIA